ncbi:MAG: FtsH protease activity modulator HflK [Sphingobium sp.]|nr:FtsH protease activity modulator HflK [Sphingobium xenophagum]MBS86930.1 FtsH protease activity modulator HflK [Sphingobium sp.]OUC56818.1 HflK protein [Sphingobium sp. GW456-12-10-14-TSB1]PSO12598.1 FtsH protease activity modulator HflK [Sphingobium sp. AEW4]TAJ76140.1 MAG: FtsH protease activity modulator HflK [Sphingobium sp.]
MPGIMSMAQGPWGGKSDGPDGNDGKGSGGDGGPRNPWTQPNRPTGQKGPSAIDELLRRGRESFGQGGGGGGFGGLPPRANGKALWPAAIALLVILWLVLTSFHRVGPQERGVVTLLGKYSRTLSPGISLTLPAPFETVSIVDVEEIRTIDVGSTSAESENLVLTGDQNIIDLAYSVRWNIRNPELYLFQLSDPDAAVREVAESAMRAVLASVSLDDALGAGRTAIEQQVEQRMQEILDGYRSGIRIQGVAIKQADPPSAVNDAFKAVSAAQQTAQTYLNEARAAAQQVTAKAQGEAASFDKVYEQYRLSPDVTRRRMYYETMEGVLSNVDKTIVEGGNVTPYLPLPEIKRRAQATPATGSAASTGGQ